MTAAIIGLLLATSPGAIGAVLGLFGVGAGTAAKVVTGVKVAKTVAPKIAEAAKMMVELDRRHKAKLTPEEWEMAKKVADERKAHFDWW